MSPFPKWQRCLGLTPNNGLIEIVDRYIRVAFNVKLAAQADESCLYSNFEVLEKDKSMFNRMFNLADITEGFNKLRDTFGERQSDMDLKAKERTRKKNEEMATKYKKK